MSVQLRSSQAASYLSYSLEGTWSSAVNVSLETENDADPC